MSKNIGVRFTAFQNFKPLTFYKNLDFQAVDRIRVSCFVGSVPRPWYKGLDKGLDKFDQLRPLQARLAAFNTPDIELMRFSSVGFVHNISSVADAWAKNNLVF